MVDARPVFFPRGVTDQALRTSFVADDVGGIVAVDLNDGRVSWRSHAASQPLMVIDDVLAAQRPHPTENALQVVMLEAGEVVLESAPIALPDWASTDNVRVGAGTQKEELLLAWEAGSRYQGGAPPPPHVLHAARKTAVGAVAINLASGTVRGLDDVPDCLIPPEDGSCLDDHTRVTLNWQQLDDHILLSVRVGEIVRKLENGAGLVARLTPNGRHVLVRGEPEQRWRIYRSETGELAATVAYESGADCPCVLGDRVYYLLEKVRPSGARADILIARDIATDQMIWELRLSERMVKLPPPPRP